MSSKLVRHPPGDVQKRPTRFREEYAGREDLLERTRRERVRIGSCRTEAWPLQDPKCGSVVIFYDRCRSKWCPSCATARHRKARIELLKVVSKWRSLKDITLTVKSLSFGQLGDMRRRFMSAFRRLRQRVLWKRKVRSAFYFYGLTTNNRARTWHFHVHVAADAEFIDNRELQEAWRSCAGREGLTVGPGTMVQAASDPKSLVEHHLKGTKDDLERLEKAFHTTRSGQFLMGEAIEAFHGAPWYRPLGRAIKAHAKAKKDLPDRFCPRCGSPFKRKDWTVLHWEEERPWKAWPIYGVHRYLLKGAKWRDVFESLVYRPEDAEDFIPESSTNPTARVPSEFAQARFALGP